MPLQEMTASATRFSRPGNTGEAGDSPNQWRGFGWRYRRRAPAGQRWRWVLWSLLLPSRGPRVWPTLSGLMLGALVAGIGLVAYNTANNILFITLSLLMACLLLNVLLQWFNFRGMAWRMRVTPAWRVGVEHTVLVAVRNSKRTLPTYALWFDLAGTSLTGPAPATTPTRIPTPRELFFDRPRGKEPAQPAGRVTMKGRLDPGEQTEVEWRLRPAHRGLMRVELETVGSVFPFGFLQVTLPVGLSQTARVWPAATDYRMLMPVPSRQPQQGERRARNGPRGGDLRALRRYAPGDPQRHVHWKASARLQRLMVREFSAEQDNGIMLWLQTPAEVWSRAGQFELLCSFAATLAEDYYRACRLRSVGFNAEAAMPVRHGRDLEVFLDRVAEVAPVPIEAAGGTAGGGRRGLLTFAPDGARGVLAYVDGIKTAAA